MDKTFEENVIELQGLETSVRSLKNQEEMVKARCWTLLKRLVPDYGRLELKFDGYGFFRELNNILKWSVRTSKIVRIDSQLSYAKQLYITKKNGLKEPNRYSSYNFLMSLSTKTSLNEVNDLFVEKREYEPEARKIYFSQLLGNKHISQEHAKKFLEFLREILALRIDYQVIDPEADLKEAIAQLGQENNHFIVGREVEQFVAKCITFKTALEADSRNQDMVAQFPARQQYLLKRMADYTAGFKLLVEMQK